eukprot:1336979-Pleurochrysis_carterae.AAC.4
MVKIHAGVSSLGKAARFSFEAADGCDPQIGAAEFKRLQYELRALLLIFDQLVEFAQQDNHALPCLMPYSSLLASMADNADVN